MKSTWNKPHLQELSVQQTLTGTNPNFDEGVYTGESVTIPSGTFGVLGSATS